MNLLRDIPDARAREVNEPILVTRGVRIERIVSLGQASPAGYWYDQAEAEWVMLLTGAARLRFADETEARTLGPGDCVRFASRQAKTRHAGDARQCFAAKAQRSHRFQVRHRADFAGGVALE